MNKCREYFRLPGGREVAVDSRGAPGAVFADALHVALFVGRAAFPRRLVVVEVEDDAAELHETLADAAVFEAKSQLGVLVSPSFEGLVVSVHAQGIFAPERHVATAGRSAGSQHPVEYCGDRDAQGVVAVADAPAQGGQRRYFAAEDFPGQCFGDDSARPGDIVPLFGEGDMVLNEVALQDQVAVDLYDVFATARRDGFVADHGQAEPLVLVPDVPDGDGRHRFEMADDIAGADT